MTEQKQAGPGEARRWAQEASRFTGDECLLWPFKAQAEGYGVVRLFGRRTMRVSRYVCLIAHGEPDGRMDAAHSCGNRLCCNPKHLRWATRSQNQADTLEHGTHNRGERNYKTTLTEDDVRTIRREREAGTSGVELARRYGITQASVCDIIKGRSWAWLEGENA